MAENDTTEEEVVESSWETQPGRSPMLGKLAIGAFVGVVIAVECIFAYFWIPSKKDLEEKFRDGLAVGNPLEVPGDSPSPRKPAMQVVEVELMELSVSRLDPKSNITLRVDYQPIATVKVEDQDKFAQLYEQKKGRLRDKINGEIRKASYPDLTDPELGLIKRRIKETSNALLGKPIIQEIFFKDFSVIQH